MSEDFLKDPLSLFSVKGKTAIVTGATGAFGALAAKVLAGAGANVVIAAGAFAFAGTFIIHGIFGYRLHAEFGWLTSAYPRYYLPLAALLPLAGVGLLGAIERPAARAILLVFLIVGPLVFRLLAEPFG